MKILLPIIILVFNFSIFGQILKPCSANLLKAEIRGFKLGTSKDAITQVFDNPDWEVQPEGDEIMEQTVFEDKKRFDGVASMQFKVYKNSLFSMTVVFDDTVKFTNVGTFANELSKAWKITDKWHDANLASISSAIINCKERLVMLDNRKILTIGDKVIAGKITKLNK